MTNGEAQRQGDNIKSSAGKQEENNAKLISITCRNMNMTAMRHKSAEGVWQQDILLIKIT